MTLDIEHRIQALTAKVKRLQNVGRKGYGRGGKKGCNCPRGCYHHSRVYATRRQMHAMFASYVKAYRRQHPEFRDVSVGLRGLARLEREYALHELWLYYWYVVVPLDRKGVGLFERYPPPSTITGHGGS